MTTLFEGNAKPREGRFFDEIQKNGFVHSDLIHGFVGRRLRANRLVQKTDGMASAMTAIDHVLVFHLGGGAAERYSGGRQTGLSDRLRTATLIPAYDHAAWHIPQAVNVLHLYMDDDDLRRFAATEYEVDPDRIEMRDLMGMDDAFVAHLTPLVLQELKSDLPQSHLMLDGFDGVVAGHLLRAYSNLADTVLKRDMCERHHRDKKAVRRARDILMDRLSENVTAHEVAAELGISPYRLMRMFKREVGVTLHQFVMQERVALVKDRLVNSSDSLAEISYDAGFASQSHMST